MRPATIVCHFFLLLYLIQASGCASEPVEVPASLLSDLIAAEVGVKPARVEQHPEFVRIYFAEDSGLVAVEVTYRRGPSPFASELYLVQTAPEQQAQEDLLMKVLRVMERLEQDPNHQAMVSSLADSPAPVHSVGEGIPRSRMKNSSEVSWYWEKGSPAQTTMERIGQDPTLGLQLLLLLSLVFVAFRARDIVTRITRVPRASWAWLGLITGLGLLFRLVNGVHVPGFISGHGMGGGFSDLRHVLISVPPGANSHGNGYEALYGLVTWLLPSCEWTVLSVQVGLSVLCIPLAYALARLWLGDDRPALWAALVLALMPISVYFATSEVRTLAGSFFSLLGLAMLELAFRDHRLTSLLSAAGLTVFATQFHPVLYALPIAGAVVILCRQDLRSMLRLPQTWVATFVFMALLGVFFAISLSVWSWQDDSLVGRGFFMSAPDLRLLFVPSIYFQPDTKGNAFLFVSMTPPTLPLLVLIGLLFALRSKIWMAFIILACALILTWPGMFGGRLNLGRLQLQSQPFWAMLVGFGVHQILFVVRSRWGGLKLFPGMLAAGVLVAGTAVWSGPLANRYTPVSERQLVRTGLPKIEKACAVLFAPEDAVVNWAIPSYLEQQGEGGLSWGGLRQASISPELFGSLRCAYYFRSSFCYAVLAGEKRQQALRPACLDLENGLVMEPVHVENLPALADDTYAYSREQLELGFFRIKGVRDGAGKKDGDQDREKIPGRQDDSQ